MTIGVGSEIGGTRLTQEIAQGGMATVYAAEQLATGESVVVKVLRPEYARNEQLRRRFVREARYATSLDHPHVVRVHDAGEAEGVHYIVMQYVRGTDLRAWLASQGPLHPYETIRVLGEIADALDAAHASGLLHRDVKPGNVLIASGEGPEPPGHSYLTDFGLSQDRSRDSGALTLAGEFVGSVLYAAPEQILGTELDARADVYSLGCVLYESLVGTPPFSGEIATEVMQAHLESPPPKPSKQVRWLAYLLFDDVIARALAKDPGDRYATCGELIAAARDALGLAAEPAPPAAARAVLSLRLTLDFDAPEATLQLGERSDEVRIAPRGGSWRIAAG